MNRSSVALALLVILALGGCTKRDGKPYFERREPDVEEGIAHLRRSAAAEALASFDRAIARYPSAPEVSLDRGLALLADGKHAEAREAFVRALGEGASPELRAEALFDIGLSHHREADAPVPDGAEPNREAVMQSLRDAIEAYRRSLRTRPGQRDVAWNLEIALRRQHEEEEEQRQEQENQEQENQDQQNQDQQNQDQQNQDQQNQDQQNQDQQNQDQQNQDQQNQDQQDQQQANQGQPRDQQNQQNQQNQAQDQQNQRAEQQPAPEPREQERQAEARPASASPDGADSLTPEMRAMLDALDRGEGSLEEERARARAARENRRPLQDW